MRSRPSLDAPAALRARLATAELLVAPFVFDGLQALAAAACKVRHISSDRGTLEDVFLALTGRQLRD